MRLYGFQSRILDNFKREIDAYVAIIARVKHREFLLGFAALGTLLLSDAATYGLLVRDVARGMPIADFSMYLAAALSLSAQLKLLAEKAGTVYSEGEYAYDMFRFWMRTWANTVAHTRRSVGIRLRSNSKRELQISAHGKYIFKNLDFTIHKGERLAIVGVNGAGKSTLVKLMTGLFAPTEGEILINGVPIGAFNKKRCIPCSPRCFRM